MGSTFAGIHVRCTDLHVLRDALLSTMAARGLAPSEVPTDRTVALIRGGAWIAVLDDGSEFDPEFQVTLAKALSRGTSAPAVAVMVHDSDALRLTLFEAGRQRDRFDSDPAFMGTRTTRLQQHIDAWAHLAVGDSNALSDTFTRDNTFAEQALEPLARALGCDRALLGTGHRYQAEAGWPLGTVLLYFRDPKAVALVPAEGDPVLVSTAPLVTQPVGSGDEVAIGLALRNKGGPTDGLRLFVAGAEELVTWSMVACPQLPGERGRGGTALLRGGVATLEFTLPAGLLVDEMALVRMDPRNAVAILSQGSLYLRVIGTAKAPGDAPVTVRLEDRQGRLLFQADTEVTVRSMATRPLHAMHGLSPIVLEPLDDETWLTAQVICTLPRDRAVERLGAVVATLAPHLPNAGKVHRTLFPAGNSQLGVFLAAAPVFRTSAAATLFTGKVWKGVLQELADGAAEVELRFGGQDEGPDTSTARINLGSGLAPAREAATALAVSLMHATEDAYSALCAAIDGQAAAGGIAQAWVSRRGGPTATEVTHYEACCGIAGQCTLTQDWVNRWLRAVPTGALWIGPGLQRHLQRPSMGPLAEVGDTWKIEIADRSQAEPLLVPVLASQGEWKLAVLTGRVR